jgi:hypothetical protein
MQLEKFNDLIQKIQTNNQDITDNEVKAYIEQIKNLNINTQSWDDLMLHKVIISYGYALYFTLKQQDNPTTKLLAAQLNLITEAYYGNSYSIPTEGIQPKEIKQSINKGQAIEVDVKSRSAFASWWSCAFTSGIPAEQMAQAFLLSRFHPALIGTHLYDCYCMKSQSRLFNFQKPNWKFTTHTLPYIQAIAELIAYLLLAAAIVIGISLLINILAPGAIVIATSFTTQAIQVGATLWSFKYIVGMRQANLETQKTNFKEPSNLELDQAIMGAKVVQPTTMFSNLMKTFVKILEFYQNSQITKADHNKIIQRIYNGFDTNSDTSYLYKIKRDVLHTIPATLNR